MNLRETLDALAAKQVVIAADLGVHENCSLDSNCPKAVEIRKLIGESGITMAQLLEGYAQAQQAVEVPVDVSIPTLDCNVHLNIAGQTINVPLNDVVAGQVRNQVRSRLIEYDREKGRVERVGTGLYNSYAREVQRLRTNRALPQLTFGVEELVKASCITTARDNAYVFLFQVDYKPEEIVNNGTRSRLAAADVARIERKGCWLGFVISPANKFLSQAILLDSEGRKLKHYHGNTTDCWGNITLPPTWDRRLDSLSRLTVSLMKSLATINYNSLMQTTPAGMPNVQDVLAHATVLGREGVIEAVPEPTGRTWANTTRTNPANNLTLTIEDLERARLAIEHPGQFNPTEVPTRWGRRA